MTLTPNRSLLAAGSGLMAGLLLLSSCTPDANPGSPSRGERLNVTRYVAYGNSITAGFSDNGLYEEAQQHAFPNLLARQFQSVGGGAFTYPVLPANGSGYLTLTGLTPVGTPVLTPVPFNAAEVELALGNSVAQFRDIAPPAGGFNNLGIPGIAVSQIGFPGLGNQQNGPGNFNPYFERILPDDRATQSYIDYVSQIRGTFFTSFLGNNDVLGFAAQGADPNRGTLTPLSLFQANYSRFLDSVTRGGVQGVLMTIPLVTGAPYFTSIPYNALVLTRQGQVDSLRAAYAPYNAAVDAYNQFFNPNPLVANITFNLGANGFVIADPELGTQLGNPALGIRQARSGELITLPAAEAIGQGQGSRLPLENRFVLTGPELQAINRATNEFNTFLRQESERRQLCFYDVQPLFNQIQGGIITGGATNNAALVTGGVFSLDGIHLTPRGNAILANDIIRRINAHYNAQIPLLTVTEFRGTVLPR